MAATGPDGAGGSASGPLHDRGLCLLSLDGGGMRGLSSLMILQRLMTKINSERRTCGLNAVKPCEIFDLIGGTSTGGLIAIMLGRLEMDVKECITEYQKMIEEIFKKKHLPIDWRGRLKGRFDTEALTKSIRDTMSSSGKTEDELLNPGGSDSCKIFVCATSFEMKSVVRLKSYKLDDDADLRPTILEAARATSAATSFFEPATIGNRRYVDGALGANNPVDEVWNEAQNIWCDKNGELEPLIKCFVSIGTGHPGASPMNEGALKVLKEDMVKIATQTTRTAETFASRHRGLSEKRYFRFNVEQGLQGVGLEEHKKVGLVEAATDEYLASQAQKTRLNCCVDILVQKTGKSPDDLARILNNYAMAQVKPIPMKMATIHTMDPQFVENINFVGRHNELASIKRYFDSSKGSAPTKVCLWGPGGVGKTQLAAAYALQSRKRYSDVFKISARSVESIQEDFANIIYQVSGKDDMPFREDSGDDVSPERKKTAMKNNIRAVHEWFATHEPRWLLVIDDVHMPEVGLDPYFPRNSGHVIITSQNKRVGGYGELIEVRELSPDEAVTFLLNKANIVDDELRAETKPRATQIAKLLGYHTLAIEHAGALIQYQGMSCYWERFHSEKVKVLEESDDSTPNKVSVFKTFQLSFAVALQKNPCAAKLLVLLSYLDNTTIPEQMILPDGTPAKGIQHLALFQDHVGLNIAVSLLHELALIYRTDNGDLIQMSLHPLVHYMSRERLEPRLRWVWHRNATRLLAEPLLDPATVTQHIKFSLFKHVVHVMEQALALEDPLWSSRSVNLWTTLTVLLIHFYPYWHLHGKMEQLAAFARHAVSVLAYAEDDAGIFYSAFAATLLAESGLYDNCVETTEAVIERFIARQISSSAVAALDRSKSMIVIESSESKLISPRVGAWPMSLRRLVKKKTSAEFLRVFAMLLRRMSFSYAGRGRWSEAFLMAKFSELSLTAFGKPLLQFKVAPSQMIQSAFKAAKGADLEDIISHLYRVGSDKEDNLRTGAIHDYCKILNRRGRNAEVEAEIKNFLDPIKDKPWSEASSSTPEGAAYVWSIKALVTALSAQGNLTEAQSVLVQAYGSIKEGSADDNLGQFHSEYLMTYFFRLWELEPPLPVDRYESDMIERFERMYASDKTQLLKAEGLAMGCILLAQGALDEGILVARLFANVCTKMLGEQDPLTLRTRRVLDAASTESEKEKENKKNGDYWLHFGSMTIQRDVRVLARWDDTSNSADASSWRKAAETSRQPKTKWTRPRLFHRKSDTALVLVFGLLGIMLCSYFFGRGVHYGPFFSVLQFSE